MKAFVWDDELGSKPITEVEIPDSLRAKAPKTLRHELVEAAVEHHDELLEKLPARG